MHDHLLFGSADGPLMMTARDYLNKALGVHWVLKFIITRVLPRPPFLYWVIKAAFFCKMIGLSAILRKTGLLQKFAPTLAAADELLQEAPMQFLLDHKATLPHQEKTFLSAEHNYFLAVQKVEAEKKAGPGKAALPPTPLPPRPTRPKVAFFTACGSQYLRPSIGLATMKLFERLKLDFIIPDLMCCGLPAASYGILERVQEMAKENIKRLERGRYDAIVCDDSSCTAHVKDYYKFFQEDPAWLRRAIALSQSVRELSGYLIQWGLIDHLKKVPWTGGPVAYHDPCKAQYAQKITQPPRDLLSAIPGLKLVPVPDADQCCGGGGTYSFVHPEMSREVLAKKAASIRSTGCQTVVTSSASCLIQLAFGLQQNGAPWRFCTSRNSWPALYNFREGIPLPTGEGVRL
ncbi:MAG: (Fe-S)-binding protein [Elusimicrobia bacterium]|nr:(Fe-S)-binding protein [Candidatus Obscuribacterium magneticum]